jgi:type II secretory pathway pseudopilin PulG
VETSLVLGIVGLLSAAAIGLAKPPQMDLTCIEQEIPATVMQAMHLARARGSNVTVALGTPALGPDVLPLRLPSRVKWGKPAQVPLPKGMDDPVRADTTGEAHAKITVTPRHTATATTWFLNDGTDVLCMRLSGRCHLQLLRWRATKKAWGRV